MVIAPLPFTPEEGGDYIEDLIQQRCTLFVSAPPTQLIAATTINLRFTLHSYIEKFAPEFLKQELISTKLKTVSLQSSSSTGWGSYLKETTYLFSEKTCITHIHFTNWKDGTPCQDTTLLVYLLDHMATLNIDPTSPIAINCFGGYGHSAVIAICYYLRQKLLYSSVSLLSLHCRCSYRCWGFPKPSMGVLAGLSVYAVPQVLATTMPISPLQRTTRHDGKTRARADAWARVDLAVSAVAEAQYLRARLEGTPAASARPLVHRVGFLALAAFRAGWSRSANGRGVHRGRCRVVD